MIIRNVRELGGYLRQAREDRALTQAELADRLGTRRMRISRLEMGEGGVHVELVLRVMRELGIRMDLAGETDAAKTRTRPDERAAPPYSIDDIADTGLE